MSLPEYTKGQYYVWDTEAEAVAALASINASSVFPIPSKKNGVVVPEEVKTMSWSDTPRQRLDGKYCFERIPANMLEHFGISQEDADSWVTAFNPAVEVYDETWFEEMDV